MSLLKKNISIVFLAGILVLCAAAQAQTKHHDTNRPADIPSGNYTVTSLTKCLDRLPEQEAAEIRKNFTKPYAECAHRLSVMEDEKKHVAAGNKKEEASPAEDNFSHYAVVTKNPESPKQPAQK